MKTIYENEDFRLLLEGKETSEEEKPRPITYVIDRLLAGQLSEILTQTPNENLAYVSGMIIEHRWILNGILPVELDFASPVRARGNPESCTKALIHTHESLGLTPMVLAHSHPGKGPNATHQSKTDNDYHGAIEEAGAQLAGLIFSRDGFFRFFRATDDDFEVEVYGNIKPVEGHRHVYQLV